MHSNASNKYLKPRLRFNFVKELLAQVIILRKHLAYVYTDA
jgi:hypothetical protein